MASQWHLLTGEFPPQGGGVSDYSLQVAEALAARGDQVHVWAPGRVHSGRRSFIEHRLPAGYHPRSFSELDRALGRASGAHLLVQYSPPAFGCRGMNLPFTTWIARRREPLWVMFHEVASPLLPGQPFRHRLLALVQRAMASRLVRRADRVLVSTPAWAALLEQLIDQPLRSNHLAIPSNLPLAVDATRVRGHHAAFERGGPVIGHFGTHGQLITDLLAPLARAVLAKDRRRTLVLLGRGGPSFARRLESEEPALAGQLVASGDLPAREIAERLAACDLLLQPYPDGVTSRRSTASAGLALARPIVSNRGSLTEPFWDGAIALAERPEASLIAELAERVLQDAAARQALCERARALYRSRFSLEHTLDVLRLDSPAP